ncbi:MAG: LysR family transcriptional regulator [Pseudomonadota bacterium]
MDLRRLPPLAALRAFTAFAQTRGVVEAGTALGVSHAAISQQLRSLEDHLGLTLLDRSGRALALTPDGEALARACQAGFSEISNQIDKLTGHSNSRPLNISTTPTFAASWLMPRMARFRAAHPNLAILIDATPQIAALEPGGIDLALRYGTAPFPGLEATPLLISPMIVVAAPDLLGGKTDMSVDALSRLPWLEELGTTEGTNWLRRNGALSGPQAGFMQVPGNLLLDGARGGQGVAVTVRAFVQPDLDAGRLIQLHEDHTRGAGYYIVTRPGPKRPALAELVRWLKAQRDQAAG